MIKSLRIAFVAVICASSTQIALAAPTNPFPRPKPGTALTAPTNPFPQPKPGPTIQLL
jgi:hypothetical protein